MILSLNRIDLSVTKLLKGERGDLNERITDYPREKWVFTESLRTKPNVRIRYKNFSNLYFKDIFDCYTMLQLSNLDLIPLINSC